MLSQPHSPLISIKSLGGQRDLIRPPKCTWSLLKYILSGWFPMIWRCWSTRFHSLDPRADTTVDNSQEVPIEGCRDRDIAARFKEIPGRESAVPTGLCMDTENRSIERQAHRRDTRIETCMVGLHNRCATSWFDFGIDLIFSLYNRFQKRIPQMKRKASFPPTTSTSYEIGDPTGNRLHLPNDTYTKHGTGRHSMAQQGAELVS